VRDGAGQDKVNGLSLGVWAAEKVEEYWWLLFAVAFFVLAIAFTLAWTAEWGLR
jgi:hypothetical protein